MASYTSPIEKVDVMEAETVNASDRSGKGIGEVSTVTLESFSHLDEKKILRKVRLLQLYMVSVTDSGL